MVRFTHSVTVRLTEPDVIKLGELCRATTRRPSEVVRMLVGMATPTHLPVLQLPAEAPAAAAGRQG